MATPPDALAGPPLRVAVVGAGPSGFYVADALLKSAAAPGAPVEIDLFDRLPSPYGLVRYGVAPDHQEVKRVVKVYARTAGDPRVRFFGGVEFGRDVGLNELRSHYHALVFATGAATDRRLGVPGEGLRGSHSATEFVGWYNAHPDFRHLRFDLSASRVVVIGVGNVAIDVARILCRSPEELARTDIADHALEALRASRVREVLLVGRRGPAQAAFTTGELEEVGDLADAHAVALPEELVLDEVTRATLAAHPDRQVQAKLACLERYATPRPPAEPTAAGAKSRRLVFRFALSPLALLGDDEGRVRGVRLARNELVPGPDGSVIARATNRSEDVEAGLVFRSVGFRGIALPGVPFDERSGTIPHASGRVLDAPGGRALPGLYASGWIKRGPSGVIGTNRPCAAETVAALLADASAGRLAQAPPRAHRDALPAALAARGVRWFTFEQWLELDALEVARGAAAGRPRVKFVTREEVEQALASTGA